jgi:hypothetical protein
MASRRSSWGGAVETYWAAPAAARDHVAALGRPSTVCVPVGSARIARGGAQQQGDHDASITPIAGCQPDFGSQSIVGCTDCPSEKHSFAFMDLLLPPPVGREKYVEAAGLLVCTQEAFAPSRDVLLQRHAAAPVARGVSSSDV